MRRVLVSILGWLLVMMLAATTITSVVRLDDGWWVRQVIQQSDLAISKARYWIENVPLTTTKVQNWIEKMAFAFLILYALFGLGEVARHLPVAWRRLVAKWQNREFGQMAKSACGMLVAIGPVYIAIEVLVRSFPL